MRHKYRIRFSKLGPAVFLGHLELMNVLRCAFRRAQLPLRYSEGYHPHARISFGNALAVGIESECEYCDIELNQTVEASHIEEKLKDVFPNGVSVVSVEPVTSDTPSWDKLTASIFEVVNFSKVGKDEDQLIKIIQSYQGAKSAPILRRRGKKAQEVDLKPYVTELALLKGDAIRLTLNELKPMIRITEAIQGIFSLDKEDLHKLNIKKIGVKLSA